jgi:trehalose/maltose transport system permease protein
MRSRQPPLATALRRGASLGVIFVSLFPLAYAIATSFKQGSDLFRAQFWPSRAVIGNYVALFRDQPFGTNLLNSTLVAGVVVALSLGLALLSAWALGRVRFRGRQALLLTILGVSMFPHVAVLAGLFELVSALGLYDSLAALMLSDLLFTLPFTVWVLTTFMRDLPKEIEEAALMDGAGVFTMIFRVFLPMLWPALVATGLLAFIGAWNEFLFALSFTLSSTERTVPVAIALISGASSYELPWGNLMAASVIVTLPLIALVLAFQRYIVSGLTAGAVKG